MMTITILSLFPEMFAGPFDHSMIKRAREKGLITLHYVNIRDYALDRHKSVDDRPYGGGIGMVLRVDVIDAAIKDVCRHFPKNERPHIVLLDPQGTPYTQTRALTLSSVSHLVLLCGHYEGVDARIRDLVDEELSIGDYILTGGEIPAMVVVDSVVRLLPGVLRQKETTTSESFSQKLLEYPQYTRPETYKSQSVPSVLTRGNHALIEEWKKQASVTNTKLRRPDLLSRKKRV